jgi:WD40 repeat protein
MLWDSATGALHGTPGDYSGNIYTIAISPNGKLIASSSYDTIIKLWDSATGAQYAMLEGHSKKIEAIAFSPDGLLVASVSSNSTIRLWDSTTGAPRGKLDIDVAIQELSFSSDGLYLVTNRGRLSIESISPSTISRQVESPGNLFLKEHWVARGQENILWIPPDHHTIQLFGIILLF